jgi:hypothetical protein
MTLLDGGQIELRHHCCLDGSREYFIIQSHFSNDITTLRELDAGQLGESERRGRHNSFCHDTIRLLSLILISLNDLPDIPSSNPLSPPWSSKLGPRLSMQPPVPPETRLDLIALREISVA